LNRRRLEAAFRSLWFDPNPGIAARFGAVLLAPLAWLTGRVARRQRARIESLPPPAIPVVVIGNLVVGGAGKTPLVTALVDALAARGWQPGILASGYGAERQDARLVAAADDARQAGDEALLLARQTGRPTAVARRRAEALALLTATHPEVDVVLADDGLQHAGLPRCLEVAVFDRRGVGNGRLLPAGPLREPLAHLAGMDAVALNGKADSSWLPMKATAGAQAPRIFRFEVVPGRFVRLDGAVPPLSPEAFCAMVGASQPASLAAVAGIGEPQRLFDTLTGLGLTPAIRLAPGDHRTLDPKALAALPARYVVMTSKDAVKCRPWADERCWALEVTALPEPAFIDWLEHRLRNRLRET
jgi:tetraacyldisaccharide 4'-kinase